MWSKIGGLLFVVVFFYGSTLALADTDTKGSYTVVFAPFDTDAAGNYEYLVHSVQNMLSSRLASKDRIEVLELVSEAPVEQPEMTPQYLQFLRAKGVDYYIGGSLYSLTNGLNTQVVLYPTDNKKSVLRYSALTSSTDTLIEDIDQLSGTICSEAFGYTITPLTSTIKKSALNKSFTTAHPEVEYKRSKYSGTIIDSGKTKFTTTTRGVKTRKELDDEILALELADFNGDGENDLLTLSEYSLKLYVVKEKTLRLESEMKVPNTIVPHALSLGDMDGDSKQEIYISGTDGLDVSSMVVIWDAKRKFTILSEDIPWYIRAVHYKDEGLKLLGQRGGSEEVVLVEKGIFQLIRTSEGKIQKGTELPLPKSVNLFDFTFADLEGDGLYECLVVDQKERLRVYDAENSLKWVSTRSFGGSKTYLGPSVGEAVDNNSRRNLSPDEDSDRDLIFVPKKIIAIDIDGDGTTEIIINENEVTSFNLFTRLRLYDSGVLVGLSWDGEGFVESWRTGKFNGYIIDYSFDLSNDQSQLDQRNSQLLSSAKLFVANEPTSGSLVSFLPGASDIELQVYELEFTK